MSGITVEAYSPSDVDDTRAVNTDVKELYNRIIKKIDYIRSSTNIAAGLGVSANQVRIGQSDVEATVKRLDSDQKANPVRFMESRAHAFFRAIGLPTAARDGSFYCPGHNARTPNSIKLNSVDEKVLADSELVRFLLKRETDPNDRRQIFVNQDVTATAYALSMSHPIPFNLMAESEDPFFGDPQSDFLQSRQSDIQKYSSDIAKQAVGALDVATYPSHILKPFIVSPVEKALPANKRVAAPFMPSDDYLVIDGSRPPLLRPVIEYIIRRRLLAANATDNTFIENAQRLLGNANSSQTASEIKSFILALSGAENIGSVSPEFINTIRGLSLDQVATINTFVREIKGLVARLNLASNDINRLRQEIVWQPVPSKDGPEFGGVSKYGGDGSATSLTTQKIATLKLLQMAQQSNDLNSKDYTMVLNVDMQRNYNEEIAGLERKRERLGSLAMTRLREIEIITGEVSGLGLIDVFAVHTALWAIDIETLLGFLDAEAFDRLLTFNKELKAPTRTSTPSMAETLRKFERQVANVLLFAQNELERNKKNPRQVPSSDIR